MSRPGTRKGAPSYVGRPGSDLVLEPGAASGPGVREWLNSLGSLSMGAAAFDTRLKAPAVLTGRASRAIARGFLRHGCNLVVDPESFLVDKTNHLLPGEVDRAQAWGARTVRRRVAVKGPPDAGEPQDCHPGCPPRRCSSPPSSWSRSVSSWSGKTLLVKLRAERVQGVAGPVPA